MLHIYIYIYTYIIYCILYHSIISWSCFLQSCPSNMFRKGYPQELVPPPSQGANGKSGPSIQAKTCWQYPMKVLKYSKICFDCQPQRISCSKRKNNNFRFAKWWFSLFLHRSSILRLELRDDVQADALSSSNTSHPVRQITRLGVLDPVFTGAYKFLRKKNGESSVIYDRNMRIGVYVDGISLKILWNFHCIIAIMGSSQIFKKKNI